jgi:undecaprenyl-diphosphatase
MGLLQAIVLALVQGITEFLPISSAGHLILVPFFLGWPDQGLRFDIATHAGSLVAVVLYFRKDLAELAQAAPKVVTREALVPGTSPFLLLALGVGTIPVALAGLLLSGFVAGAARNPVLIASTLIGFGLLLGAADRWAARRKDVATMGWADVVVIGLFQAMALIPGTSRSGITITAGRLMGLTRPAAARFSFLLSIPVLVLVSLHEGIKALRLPPGGEDWAPLVVGFLLSAVSAYLVIGWLLWWLQSQSLQVFVIYRVLLGLLILWVAL